MCAGAWRRASRDFRLKMRRGGSCEAAVRSAGCGGTDEGGTRGDRCHWRGRASHGTGGMFSGGVPGAIEGSDRRLQAYAEAGADVLYAPGVRERRIFKRSFQR